jgi:metal-responsive CopG/Arc/MetJ family transcriptional regulator
MPKHIDGMKVRTSIMLPQELLRAVDKCARQQRKTHSDFVEDALWAFINRPTREAQDARNLEIINQ